jgi:pilus assembly protein CpaB
MSKYKPLLLLTAAVVVALITSVMAYNWLKKEADVKKATIETRPVAVAAADLPWGTALSREMIKTTPYLKGSLQDGDCFADPASLVGKVLVMPVKANEPILRSRLAPDGISTGGVAAVVDPDKRAMAVKVDKVIGVSGFVHPGNRVDVLVSLQREGKKDMPITKIVLQDILVLATGTQIEHKSKSEKPAEVDVITLEVTPEQAEKLALATSEGRIQLALRNYKSSGEVATRGETISTLLSAPVIRTKAVVSRRVQKTVVIARQDPTFDVEVFRGNNKAVNKFRVAE